MKLAVLAITQGAVALGKKIAEALEGELYPCKGKLMDTMEQVWHKHDGIICIMASGIVVRAIAPLLKDKRQDPAVVVCDEKGAFAISLLSGHLGGANELAHRVAAITGGTTVITTASDVRGRTALDLWCRDLNLTVSNKALFTQKMGKLVDQGKLTIFSDYPLPALPVDLVEVEDQSNADLIITSRVFPAEKGVLLHPKALVFGIGCKRGISADAILSCVQQTCATHNLAFASVYGIASITLKQDEAGLLACARQYGLRTDFFPPEILNAVEGIEGSPTVFKVTGSKAVAEPAAILAAGAQTLLVDKIKYQGVTNAVAENPNPFSQ
ncbi:MAG: cobalamin biosynthesis protein CbiG [Desulfobulbus propionicus]|nr:MAG: cobalamin biosynthesis protein CbiG [Desulfobulbus propionicus]